jgi:hypothetical protein
MDQTRRERVKMIKTEYGLRVAKELKKVDRKEYNSMTNKQKNRKELEEIAERIGDMYLMEMFWDMFDMLPESKQKIFVKQAREIEKNVRIIIRT